MTTSGAGSGRGAYMRQGLGSDVTAAGVRHTDRVLIVAADSDGTPRRILRDIRIPNRYSQRFLLADGSIQAFTVYAWNKDEAATLASRELRERVGDEKARGAWPYGVERAR